jgi:methylated-DNA-[protein]-cysteine S-methyltransferase
MTSQGDLYRLVPTSFGDLGMVWMERAKDYSLRRVFLPVLDGAMIDWVRNEFPHARAGVSSRIDRLAQELRKVMDGKSSAFSLDNLDLEPCTPFQRTVLFHCFRIPRGRVCTYGALARAAGVPQGARAAGTVMAGNPFPLIIPCHRVVRSNGALGGFGGGTAMKKALLVGEGVIFDERERVIPDCMVVSL